MSQENYRVDRNVVYNVQSIVPENEYLEQSIEMLFFFAYLAQKQTDSLFHDTTEVEYAIKASDFIKFTNRSKGSVYANVPGWEYKVLVRSTGEAIELGSLFDYLLFQFRYKPIPITDIYERQIQSEKNKRISMGENMLTNLELDFTKREKAREKTYYIQINPFFVKSLLNQFLTVHAADLVNIRGNRKNSYYTVFFFLLQKENQQRAAGLNSVSATYKEIKEVSNISIQSSNESSNISKTVKKFNKYLDDILMKTSLDFHYQVMNNNYTFYFNKSHRNISTEKQKVILISNMKIAIDRYLEENGLQDGKNKTLRISKIPEHTKFDIVRVLFNQFFPLEKRGQQKEPDSVSWYSESMSKVLKLDDSKIKKFYWEELSPNSIGIKNK